MRDNQKRGQILLVVVIGLLLVTILGLPASAIAMRGVETIKSGSFRIAMADTLFSLLFFGPLSYLMWTGKAWAKWMVIMLLFINALFTLTLLDDLTGWVVEILFISMILSIAMALVLMVSKDITSFMRYRETKRRTHPSLRR